MMARLAATALLLTAALPASAAEPATCAAPVDLSATPYAGWTGADGEAAALVAGTPVMLAMADGATSRGLRIETAGKYGIAADGKVWIDIVADGKPLTSVDHGHGPECSGIRKVVWFDLAAGAYELALSKAAADQGAAAGCEGTLAHARAALGWGADLVILPIDLRWGGGSGVSR